MSKLLPGIVNITLRVWAWKLEAGALTAVEAKQVAKILRRISVGRNLETVFDMPRSPGRPQSTSRQQRLHDMAICVLPKSEGGEGFSKAEAIRRLAGLHGVSEDTVRDDFKSVDFKTVFQTVKQGQEVLASMGVAGRWQGGKTPALSPRQSRIFDRYLRFIRNP